MNLLGILPSHRNPAGTCETSKWDEGDEIRWQMTLPLSNQHCEKTTLLEIATNVPNPWMRRPTLSWHHTAVALKDMYEGAQLDANDAKRELARSHKNPAQDLNEDSEV